MVCVWERERWGGRIHGYRRTTCRSMFFPSIMWFLGIKLISAGLATSTLTAWAICRPYFFIFILIVISYRKKSHFCSRNSLDLIELATTTTKKCLFFFILRKPGNYFWGEVEVAEVQLQRLENSLCGSEDEDRRTGPSLTPADRPTVNVLTSAIYLVTHRLT